MNTPLVCSLAEADEIIAERDARIAQLEAKAVESAVTIRDVLDGNWQLARVELPRIMAERDAAIRERDEAISRWRQACENSDTLGMCMQAERDSAIRERDDARRAQCTAEARLRTLDWHDPVGWQGVVERRIADEHWPGSGETLFPCAQPSAEEGSADDSHHP